MAAVKTWFDCSHIFMTAANLAAVQFCKPILTKLHGKYRQYGIIFPYYGISVIMVNPEVDRSRK